MDRGCFNQFLNKKLVRYSLDKKLTEFQQEVLTNYLGRWLLYKKDRTKFLFDFAQKDLVVYLSGLDTTQTKKAIETFLQIEKIQYKFIIEIGVMDVR